jgi:hypothetical protein
MKGSSVDWRNSFPGCKAKNPKCKRTQEPFECSSEKTHHRRRMAMTGTSRTGPSQASRDASCAYKTISRPAFGPARSTFVRRE